MKTKAALRRRIGAGLGLAICAVGCAKLLGFDDPPIASECVSDSDCDANQACVDWTCQALCEGDGCSGAGSGGAGSGGEGAMPPTGGAAGGGMGGNGGTEPEPPGGAGGENGDRIPEGGVCEPGTGGKCLVCDSTGHWVSGNCMQACREDVGCVVPPSCNSLEPSCGPNLDCCLSPAVPGGEFARTCDDVCTGLCEPTPQGYPANVTRFSLDAFEVTVGRLRRFVDMYPASRPMEGMGRNPRNTEDFGWETTWDSYLPETAEDLRAQLSMPECATTWTPDIGPNESKPANCVNWYLAQAFCAWDGGRLPTQAEWNFVAAGGDEQRVYPWSDPAESMIIDSSYAHYLSTEPAEVGLLRNGRGKWNHYDLAGNVIEWVYDVFENCYRTPDQCNDCGYTSTVIRLRTLRGGAYTDSKNDLRVDVRQATQDTQQYPSIGFRCARDLIVQ